MITEINNKTNLSEHFTLGELTKTKTGISNVPNEEQVKNLRSQANGQSKNSEADADVS